MHGEVKQAIEELTEESRLFPPIEIELGDVQVFPVSNVIYVELAKGQRDIHILHDLLERGILKHKCVFDFHPHITIAQNLPADLVDEAFRIARAQWAAYEESRTFVVESLSFVQNIAPGLWLDLAKVPLAVPVSAGG
jgi:2'-5' RNA ligase